MKHAFYNSLGNCSYVFKNGKAAPFFSGMYATDIQEEIDELNAEIAAGHPYLFINKDALTVETVDPIEALKKKHIAEYLATQAAAMDKSVETASDKEFKMTSISNSDSVGAAMSGSTSTDAPVTGTATVVSGGLAALKAATVAKG